MTPVGEFAQYLLRSGNGRDPARAALTGYFAHLAEPGAPFDPGAIAGFYGFALGFDSWRAEADALAAAVTAALRGFANEKSLAGDWSALRHPPAAKLVEILDRRDLAAIADAPGAPSPDRTAWAGGDVSLRLRLGAAGLEVSVFAPFALLWGPKLIAVPPVTRLRYGRDNELLRGVPQRLRGDASEIHVFRVEEGGGAGRERMVGLTLRGPTLHVVGNVRGTLGAEPAIHLGLKRLERHYIRAQSDPEYQDLVYRLEEANRRIAAGAARTDGAYGALLAEGRRALAGIFPNDRLLGLLVTHLDYGISQTRHRIETGGHEPAPPA